MLNNEIVNSLNEVCEELNVSQDNKNKIIKFLEYLASGTSQKTSESDQIMFIKNILDWLKL
jgi:hypothetical protein